ncbi:hypothetical protein CPC735_015660 [Coccidioides posadasii C735 delta SOWgp]|uniref:Argonaute complex, subunit Arb1 n=1 Tax=Coccidioides posadasii (strain C735) TaxID=222929 RepID=C5PD06_COCP7|nr:hypothetical protein CPC735_015660 [Coccidioides posadasii C735 delta SOWgp]EER24967.1 hypothetical protein CPC735_015660 [Coccidioides posadasii C735 delta SOWgp]|eukprot:XP_003067112.1 hypothetical protein CPC735_015660 [Coccidioides posadasii C735 delta SOWgp]
MASESPSGSPSIAETLSTAAPIDLPYRPKPGAALDKPSALNGPKSEPENDADDEENAGAGGEVAEMKRKKKKKKRKPGKSKVEYRKKPSGYEEYYVDTPMTPAEYEEEKKLYNDRLETCIQRYETKRRMNSERRDIFLKYLSYGGVNVGPKMFEGNDQKDLQRLDSEDIVTATAQTNIPEDRAHWDVDFEAVAKGFLSSVIPRFIGLETEQQVDLVTSTIKNFLNYVIYHDVCPEHRENIMAARTICDKAKDQLWKAQQANTAAPGDFNMACSTLFGGSYFGAYTGDQEWSKGLESAGMPGMTARKVVKFGIAGAGTYEQAERFRDLVHASRISGKLVHEDGFEILSITPASPEIKQFYREYAPDLNPLAKMRARAWRNPDLPAEDLPKGESPKYLTEDGSGNPAEFEFFIEDNLLKFYFVGMKIEAHVRELNSGIHYFDNVFAMYCAFHTVLPNEAMIGWKEPKDIRPDHLCWEAPYDSKEDMEETAVAEEEVE